FPGDNLMLPTSGTPEGYKTILSNDGQNYITIGEMRNVNKGYGEMFIMKTDLAGNMLWQKFLPRLYPAHQSMDIIPLQYGGYAFVSTLQDTIGGTWQPSSVYYGKLDEDCDTVWTRAYRKTELPSVGYQVVETEDAGLVLYGRRFHGGEINAVIRTDSTGRIKWYREYYYIDTPKIDNPMKFLQLMSAMSYTPNNQVLMSGLFENGSPKPGVFDSVGTFSWFILTDSFGCIEPGCQA